MAMDIRKILEANNAVAQVPKPPNYNSQPSSGGQQYGFVPPMAAGGSSPSPYPVPQNSGYIPATPGSNGQIQRYSNPVSAQAASVPTPPQPARWNADANYQDRLAHFGDANNLRDAQSELLAIKGMYGTEMGGGASNDRLGGIHAWAKNVRTAAGIREDDPIYGNGVADTGTSQHGADVGGQSTATGGQATGGYAPSTFNPDAGVPAPQVPVFQSKNPSRSRAEIAAELSRWMNDNLLKQRVSSDNQIQTAKTTAGQQLKGLETSYGRLRTQIGENRGVEDVQNQRQLSPYSGRSDATMAEVARQRGISDRQRDEDYLANQGNVNQRLADMENEVNRNYYLAEQTSGSEKERLIEEATKGEREFELAVAAAQRGDYLANNQLTDSDFQRKLGTFNTNYDVYQDQRNFGYQQQRDTANDRYRDKQSNWGAYGDMVNWTGNLGSGPKDDWGLLNGQQGPQTVQGKMAYLQSEGARLNNEMSQLQLDAYPQEQRLKIQQLQKQIAEIGKAPYRSAQDIEYDKVKLDTAREQLSQLRSGGSTKGINLSDISKEIDDSTFVSKQAVKDPETGQTTTRMVVYDPSGLKQYINSKQLTNSQKFQLYKRYNIDTTGLDPSAVSDEDISKYLK